MAHFRATIEGNKGGASRLGTKNSGIAATINGWNIGVKVYMWYDKENDRDCIHITETGGSNGGGKQPGKNVATLWEISAKLKK